MALAIAMAPSCQTSLPLMYSSSNEVLFARALAIAVVPDELRSYTDNVTIVWFNGCYIAALVIASESLTFMH